MYFNKFRYATCEGLINRIGAILVRVCHPDSGRVAETVFQLLPDSDFQSLCNLINNYFDETVQSFADTVALKIGQKIGQRLTDEQIVCGSSSVLALIHCESLRRKGHLEYLWPNDIFTFEPRSNGFTTLTDTGKQIALKEMLYAFKGGRYVQ